MDNNSKSPEKFVKFVKSAIAHCENSMLEIIMLILSLCFLLFSKQELSPTMKSICISIIIIVSMKFVIYIINRCSSQEEGKQNRPLHQDILTNLHNTTNKLITSTIKVVTMRTFLLFVVALGICIYIKECNNQVLERYSEYIFAISTTLFTIWVIEIIYNSQMDELNAQKIDNTLMKIFENRKWIRQMDEEWRETAISECLIGSFGEELGKKYAQKTIGSQLKQDTYRLSFDYVVSLKEEKNINRLIQELSYKKRVNFKQIEKLNISSVFEFEENRFYEPSDKNEVVFFKEEIRSNILKSLLRYSCSIAKCFVVLRTNNGNYIRFTEGFENIINWIRDDVVNGIIRNIRDSEVAASYRQFYDGIDDNNKKRLAELICDDKIKPLHTSICETLNTLDKDINEVWYSVVRVLIADYKNIEDIDSEQVCSDIMRLLVNYKCTELDKNGNLAYQKTSMNERVAYIVKKNGNTVEDIELSTIFSKLNENKMDIYSRIMGVKFVSEVNTYMEGAGVYFYARMTCDYPIYNQNTFYWKFGEPMIGTSFLMSFPGSQDMDRVHAVQYFSDNHQSVTIDKGASTVSFYAEDLLLPESGIYVHWSKGHNTTAKIADDNTKKIA